MILTLDVGNTNTVLGVFHKDRLIKHWRISTDKNKTSDEYGVLLNNLFSFADLKCEDVKGILISSVVPPVVSVLKETARYYFNLQAMIVGPGVKTGINIKMEDPREVGADRIVNAVGGYNIYGGPLIIVDFGTATTFCAVSEKGDYLGGAIAPGINVSTEALIGSAAKLPRIELECPDSAIAKNTITAMQAGIIYGFVGQVEALIKKIRLELATDVQVIGTGGLVNLIADETDLIDIVEPFLTLKGLHYIGKLNGIRGE